MSTRSTLVLAALLSTAACHHHAEPSSPASADADTDDPVADAIASIRGEDLATHVRVLASDEFEGRFPGSPGEAKTVAYISAHFARHGLQPGVGNSYLQPVPLVSVTLDARSTASLTGAGETRSLRVPDELVVGSASALGTVELHEAEVVFAGYGIVAPEHQWDDYAGVDVRGKVVVVLPGDPGLVRGDPELFEGRALSLHGTSAHKAELAAARGAAALLTLYTPDALGIPWEVLAQGAQLPRQQLAEPHGPPTVALHGLVPLERLVAGLDEAGAANFEALRKAAPRDGFVARPLPLRLSASLHREVETVVSHNVIGILPGSERPEEHVIYTAHWDHVGHDPDQDGDGIFNGAVDNATGIAALLELAEAFAALPHPPARSVVLVATTAEEQGLLGATHYVEHPLLPLADAVGVINMDALFPFGETRGMTVVALGSSELDRYMDDAARTVGRRLVPDPSPEHGAFFRSDHYPFAHRGVPAIFAVGGPDLDPAAGETVPLERFADFVRTRYHQVGDEYDEASWDMAGIVQDVTIYFRTGYSIAMDDHRPQWSPSSPFRARHEALRAGG